VLIYTTGHHTTYEPSRPRDCRSLVWPRMGWTLLMSRTRPRFGCAFAATAATRWWVVVRLRAGLSPEDETVVEQRSHPVHAEIVKEIVRRIGRVGSATYDVPTAWSIERHRAFQQSYLRQDHQPEGSEPSDGFRVEAVANRPLDDPTNPNLLDL
jgi:hypothetical protein